MAKVLVVVNDPPYGTERAYNGLRLARQLLNLDEGPDVRVFLVGDGSACAKKGQSLPSGYYNHEMMLKQISGAGGTVGVCATCMDCRGIRDDELVEGARRSSLREWAEWTLWADKVLIF